MDGRENGGMIHFRYRIALFILGVFIYTALSGCFGFNHYRDFKPISAGKIHNRKDLHVVIEEDSLYYRLKIRAIPTKFSFADYAFLTKKLSQTKYYLDYTFWVFSNHQPSVTVSTITIALDNGDTLRFGDFIQKELFPVDTGHETYFFVARNGIQWRYDSISPIMVVDGNYASTGSEYRTDSLGIEIPDGVADLTATTVFAVSSRGQTIQKTSTISLKFEKGKRLSRFF